MNGRRKITAARRVQYGALPYRLAVGSRPQFMLVTSRETRRWIIPKGWPKKGKSPHHSAAREAFEEAGVVGAVARRSVGSFTYEKRLKNGGAVVCEVRVFPLQVRRHLLSVTEVARRGFENFIKAQSISPYLDEPVFITFVSAKIAPAVGDFFGFNGEEVSLLETTLQSKRLKARLPLGEVDSLSASRSKGMG
jgi:8-oxo-dGTP pyrophosphatase MutT (NUDIX family)